MHLKNFIVSLIAICFSFGAAAQKDRIQIDFEGIYISRDTINFDLSKPKEITMKLLKFNKDGHVQVSKDIVYEEGKLGLSHSNILKHLNSFSSYKFTLRNKSKIIIECNRETGKKEWVDFATPRSKNISELFYLKGNMLIRKNKSNKYFGRKYILDKTLNQNHKKRTIGNGC